MYDCPLGECRKAQVEIESVALRRPRNKGLDSIKEKWENLTRFNVNTGLSNRLGAKCGSPGYSKGDNSFLPHHII